MVDRHHDASRDNRPIETRLSFAARVLGHTTPERVEKERSSLLLLDAKRAQDLVVCLDNGADFVGEPFILLP